MVKYVIVALGLLLSGCAGQNILTQDTIEKEVDEPAIITHNRFNEIINLNPPSTDPLPIAVYRFQDMTGQRKPNNNYASLSSAVTQGGEVFLIKALQYAGKGKWFQPV
jgi:curli production assembly/transport component CsgG